MCSGSWSEAAAGEDSRTVEGGSELCADATLLREDGLPPPRGDRAVGRGHTVPDHSQGVGMTGPVFPPWPATSPVRGRLRLRPVEMRDSAMARELSTDPYVSLTGSLPSCATECEAKAWVRRQQMRHPEGAGFSFAIAIRADDGAIGHCGLWLKELGEGRATAGYAIVPSRRNQGFASEALALLTEFAWTVPGLRRVALHIESWNVASLRTAENAGYVREGVLARHQMIGGEHRDMVLYAAIRQTGLAR
ncbi:GNAT family N-acetyltransferase [Brevibacterium limosum]|uniref:GNAT family N-acetyltransferase n=1 Tax=Brevibacterium limosum TaxID=2697565 RepID=UPI002B1BCE6C|nr:GNAT family protein [Brevibacterium limosum]